MVGGGYQRQAVLEESWRGRESSNDASGATHRESRHTTNIPDSRSSAWSESTDGYHRMRDNMLARSVHVCVSMLRSIVVSCCEGVTAPPELYVIIVGVKDRSDITQPTG